MGWYGSKECARVQRSKAAKTLVRQIFRQIIHQISSQTNIIINTWPDWHALLRQILSDKYSDKLSDKYHLRQISLSGLGLTGTLFSETDNKNSTVKCENCDTDVDVDDDGEDDNDVDVDADDDDDDDDDQVRGRCSQYCICQLLSRLRRSREPTQALQGWPTWLSSGVVLNDDEDDDDDQGDDDDEEAGDDEVITLLCSGSSHPKFAKGLADRLGLQVKPSSSSSKILPQRCHLKDATLKKSP